MENTQTTSTQSVSTTTSDVINLHTQQNGKSLRQIAYYSGVPYSYVRRLAQQEIVDEKIDPVKLFQVVKFIKNPVYAYDLIEPNPKWEKKVRTWTGYGKTQAEKIVEKRDVEKLILRDEQTTLAFILSFNKGGTTVEQLRDVGGNLLVKAAEFLVGQDILKINGNKVVQNISGDDQYFSFSREACARMMPIFIKHYDVTHAGSFRNYIFTGNQSVTQEFIREFFDKVAELRQWFDINSVKEENTGKNPLFFSMVMDTFTDELVPSKKEVLQ